MDGSKLRFGPAGELLIEILRLDDDDYTRYRKLMLDTLSALSQHEPGIFLDWMGFPDNLPDLSHPRKRPPNGNSRPRGVSQSCFARRERGTCRPSTELQRVGGSDLIFWLFSLSRPAAAVAQAGRDRHVSGSSVSASFRVRPVGRRYLPDAMSPSS